MPSRRISGNSVQDELTAIKRLLVLQLITSGVQATDVAKALRISKSGVSQMIPARKVKKARHR